MGLAGRGGGFKLKPLTKLFTDKETIVGEQRDGPWAGQANTFDSKNNILTEGTSF